jgi:ribosomal-protein-alanine N-acetyltransferase
MCSIGDLSYKFDRLGVDDLENLVTLEKICFPCAWTECQFRLSLDQDLYYVFGLKAGNELAAYISFNRVADEMEILKLAVHPAHRRKGLAERLLRFVLQDCAKKGIRQVYLEVRRSNMQAIALYNKFGFIKLGIRKGYYEDKNEDALVLFLPLKTHFDIPDLIY